MVLTSGENVISLLVRSCVGITSLGMVVDPWIASKIIVKGPLETSWLIDLFQTTGTVGDVSISSTSVIGIVHRLRMDMSQTLTWSRLGNNK